MTREPINIASKYAEFSEHWAPRIIAQMNDYHIKLAKIQGDFVWHTHKETDEVFLVIAGRMTLEFRDGKVDLGQGEMFVVPKGVVHKPSAKEECQLMLIEPAGTANTGDEGGERTAADDVWI